MNDAVYKFKRYEDASLEYTGINKSLQAEVGGFDTVISREEYEAKEQAAKELEMAAAKKKEEKEMKRLEEEEERRIEQMYDEYEDEGGIVLGPNEFIDPLTNEPAQKKKNTQKRRLAHLEITFRNVSTLQKSKNFGR